MDSIPQERTLRRAIELVEIHDVSLKKDLEGVLLHYLQHFLQVQHEIITKVDSKLAPSFRSVSSLKTMMKYDEIPQKHPASGRAQLPSIGCLRAKIGKSREALEFGGPRGAEAAS